MVGHDGALIVVVSGPSTINNLPILLLTKVILELWQYGH